MAETLMMSVGKGAANRPQDVATVQRLLNRAGARNRVPKSPVDVDGMMGPQTLKAIQEFQQAYLKTTETMVEPNKLTLAKLNEMAGDLPPLNDGVSYLTPQGDPGSLA